MSGESGDITGIQNGNFASTPSDTTANISDEDNPLPGWSFVQSVGTSVTAAVTADATLASGFKLTFTSTAGDSGHRSYIEQLVPIRSDSPADFAYQCRANVLAGTGAASDMSVVAYAQFVTVDAVTTTGTEGTDTGDSGALTAIPNGTGSAPANAAYLRIRIEARVTDFAPINATRVLENVFLLVATPRLLVTSPSSAIAPGMIKQDSSTLSIYPFGVSAGGLELNGTAGVVVLPSARLEFSGGGNATADANTLDWYEEGTWTPVLTFATMGNLVRTYSAQRGEYQRVGDRCHFSFTITTATFTHTTASGNLEITGLPFTSEANQGFQTAMLAGYTKANYTHVGAFTPSSTTMVRIQAGGSGQPLANIVAADMPTGGTVAIRVSGSYKVG
jgi:hypothetical protein